jgi:hypothetical protein
MKVTNSSTGRAQRFSMLKVVKMKKAKLLESGVTIREDISNGK